MFSKMDKKREKGILVYCLTYSNKFSLNGIVTSILKDGAYVVIK
jgi:hypothetical protein